MNKNIYFIFGILVIIFSGFALSSTIISDAISRFGGDVVISQDKTINISALTATDNNVGSVVNLLAVKGESKPYLKWWDYTGRGVGWFGCHFNSTTGTQHQHCSFETINNSGDWSTRFWILYNRTDSEMTAGFTSLDRVEFDGVDIYLKTASADITSVSQIDLYPNGQETIGLRIDNSSSSIRLQALNADEIQVREDLIVTDSNYFRITSNSSGMTCDTDHAGSIYYDGTAFKHYGCNSTTWVALY